MRAIEECQNLIKRWYLGEPVRAIRMAVDDGDEMVIQMLMVELLRDLIDNPMPTDMLEGSQQFNEWFHFAFCKVMNNLNFQIGVQEINSIKNLAWNFLSQGIMKTCQDPKIQGRVYMARRMVSQQ